MSEITIPIIWVSNEYINTPDSVTLDFTNEEIEKLKVCIDFAEKQNVWVSMDINAENNIDDPDDFIPGYECIRVYSENSLYYYAQSKHDAATQIESEKFSLESILNTSINENNSTED